MTFILTEVEARILGCLLEKQTTTPDVYPLTLNNLVLACNQKSNRDPVVNYDDRTVISGLDGLRDKKLAILIGQDGARVPKYGHILERTLPLSKQEQALLCVLLLRGPQTPGELKTRTERLADFASIEEVEQTLNAMITHENLPPLVVKLPVQAGKREARYTHLLCGEPELPEPDAWMPPPEPARQELTAEQTRLTDLENKVAELQDLLEKMQAELAEQRQLTDKLKELL
ncbi:MAG: DUF480 domain-containing protein [Lentisphaerae bacterium]|jgi:uncharacterized protein YceH (UPF0502 family)|nr:DUF480 domain-containing protein [Lentisphaerota bacterium]